MAKVSPIDYKRVSSLPWQTINVEIPEELVVPKGNSSLARKRCRAAEARLRGTVRDKLTEASRRRFRGPAADGWQVEGQAPSTIRNSLKPLQAIYRRARSREGIPLNPTHDLELPFPDPSEVEILAPEIAAQLLDALELADRVIWATALYAGLRYGELRALRWGAINFDAGTIRVRESWDPKMGSIAPKTRTSQRSTPIPSVLRGLLLRWQEQRADAANDELLFAGSDRKPFHAASLYRRADRAWKRAGLDDRLRLHQARHTYASFMIAAGVNAKALSVFMGHSSIKVTFDLYGHLMPGAETEAAALLDRFLGPEAGPSGGSRIAIAI